MYTTHGVLALNSSNPSASAIYQAYLGGGGIASIAN